MLNKKIPLTVILLSSVILSFASAPKNILVLHSYNSGLSWTDNINNAIFESFENENLRSIDLRCEFMDTKHIEDSAYLHSYKAFIQNKYTDIPIDLIICSDNAAFDFLSQYRDEIFANTPVVFCGVNYCDTIPIGFTGVMEDVNFKSNIENILAIHPNYKTLYIINDNSITGKIIGKELSMVIEQDFPDLRYEFLTDYSLSGLQNKLSTLNSGDVVLLMLFNFDNEGNTYSFDIILDELTPYCHVPIYGVWDFYLGKGIVGGRLTNGWSQGSLASDIAKQILKGTNVDSIAVISGNTHYIFDHNILAKNGISKSLLPKNSEIVNSPYDVVSENKILFILIFLVFVLLVVLAIVLYVKTKSIKSSLQKERMLSEKLEINSTELIRALDKAEQSNRLKDSFLQNISHEIRTPLNAILGFTDLLESNENKESRIMYTNIIKTSGKQLVHIINDIVDISLIESDLMELKDDIIPLNRFVDETITNYTTSRKIGNKIILLNPVVDESIDVFIHADKDKLTRVLINLISNANKFTDDGTVEVEYTLKDKEIEFLVKDNGIGIAKKNMDKIFDRFVKIEHDNSRLYGGNGLGLSISKGYIELMKGSIWVESEEGKGSSFYFTIPFNEAKNISIPSRRNNKKTESPDQSVVILIAEDEKINFLVLKELLKNHATEIIHAEDGEEAVKTANSRSDIDLVLMDFKMPKMNGFDATRQILKTRKDLPIILQSAYTLPEDKEAAKEAGCVDFISKPINKKELYFKIEKYLGVKSLNLP